MESNCYFYESHLVELDGLANSSVLRPGPSISLKIRRDFHLNHKVDQPKAFRNSSVSLPRARNSSTAASPERAYQVRLQEVQEACPEPYPRLAADQRSLSCSDFTTRYNHLANNETVENDSVVVNGRFGPVLASASFCSFVLRLVGRVRTSRLAGSKLIFFDLVQNGHKVQAMCNLRLLEGITPAGFKKLYRLLRRGDAFCTFFSCILYPHRLNIFSCNR